MDIKLDLHIHSALSPDGRMTVREIVSRAKAAGLHGAAICDHDAVYDGETDFRDFLLIPGAEFSTEYGHLLGLFLTGPVEGGDFAATAATIRAQGGLAVLAHPFQRLRDPEKLAPLAQYLDGAEVWNGRAERKNPRANAMAREFAEEHGLRFFAGSDAHLPEEIGNGVVSLEAAELTPECVKAALMSAPVAISGKRGRSECVAESQLTKLKKTGAGPRAYAKWTLFAAKCRAEDVLNSKGEK